MPLCLAVVLVDLAQHLAAGTQLDLQWNQLVLSQPVLGELQAVSLSSALT